MAKLNNTNNIFNVKYIISITELILFYILEILNLINNVCIAGDKENKVNGAKKRKVRKATFNKPETNEPARNKQETKKVTTEETLGV